MYAELRRANVGTDSNSSASQPTASAGTSADVHHAADAFPDTTVAQMQHSRTTISGETPPAEQMLRSRTTVSGEPPPVTAAQAMAFQQLPKTAVMTAMPEVSAAFQAIPEVQSLQIALKGTHFIIVGGAVRDIIHKPGGMIKDIDCQVSLTSKEDILDLVRKHYDEDDIKVQPMAVTVGQATDRIDGIDLLVAQPNFEPAAVENDVNSLMFDLETGTLIDPFGTGLENLRAAKFRIVEPDMEAWYSYQMPGRRNNGKAPRLLKMLYMGFAFADPDQQSQFIACLQAHLPKDLTEKVIAGKFSAWAMVLGMNIRGDTFDFKAGTVHVGTCPIKQAKYEGCLAALLHLDDSLGHAVQDYMAQVTELGACP